MVVRPSYVLGGRAMEIACNREQLLRFGVEAVKVSGENPILIDQYLADAIEVDVDCIADGDGDVYVAGVMEHIEEAGIHSGDSACSLPPYSLPPAIITELKAETEAMAKALKVKGLMNVQYAVKDGEIFVLEVNPRASRTVPFVAKATGVAVAKIGALVMAGRRLAAFELDDSAINRHVAVKEAVFPFNRFPNVDCDARPGDEVDRRGHGPRPVLRAGLPQGPAWRRGEAAEAGTAFISVKDNDKPAALMLARRLTEMGFTMLATRGTAARMRDAGLALPSGEQGGGGPAALRGQHQVRRCPAGHQHRRGWPDRGGQLRHPPQGAYPGVPHYTTVAGARAAVHAIAALKAGTLDVAPLQSYFNRSF